MVRARGDKNPIDQYVYEMPVGKEKHIANTNQDGERDDDGGNTNGGPGGWLGRLLCGLRKMREPAEINGKPRRSSTLRSKPNVMIVESGMAALGSVRDPQVAIPAEIMFNAQRASLYSSMLSLLVFNPYYFSRIISKVKYHECDALLSIILDSVFGSPAYEPSLTALFTEIIEMEVDRTSSIDTVMRNDAPSVHMLSAYLKKQCCLDYLRIAVGPTIETIASLGNVSLDPEIASVYQDWARTQRSMRLPMVVGAVEAASYTEVQNLSRRRQRHLVHLATHCLHDIINSHHHIPAGLLSICRSTLHATRKKFPEAEATKVYSLVGGIFFLRFVNAALTTPSQYGLLDDAPLGSMKTNLKLVARLMQRLSNNVSKAPEEWPVDARKFIKNNLHRFRSFLESLTTTTPTTTTNARSMPELSSVTMGVDLEAKEEKERVDDAEEEEDDTAVLQFQSLPQTNILGGLDEKRYARLPLGRGSSQGKGKTRLRAHTTAHRFADRPDGLPPLSLTSTVSGLSATSSSKTKTKNNPAKAALSSVILRGKRSRLNLASSRNGARGKERHGEKAAHENSSGSSSEKITDQSSSGSSSCVSPESCSTKSMYNISTPATEKERTAAEANSTIEISSNSVMLPLNDLYLLQKYLCMYEDAWMPGEASQGCKRRAFDKPAQDSTEHATPMKACVRPSLEIVLDKPELLIRGSFDEATAVLLSGKLHVHLTEPIRVRSLKLSFTGRIDTVISQVTGANANKDEHREFFSHHWEFLPTQRPPVTWGPHSKTFDFELLLPGDNPETVATSLGKIQYRLMATLERSGFHGNLQTTIPVFVKRGPLSGAPWALALMESIETTGQWDKQLEYRVSVPTRSLKDGELFHTRFELEPRAKGIKLVAVGVLIKEYTRYYSASGEPLHRFAKVVARNENFIGPSGTCSTLPQHPDNCLGLVDATSVQIPMVVPEAYKGIQYDVITDVIETRHRIKFLIKIRDTVGLLHSIFIAVPVSIMPVTARDDSNLLPRYETAVMNPGIVIMRSNTLPPSYDVIAKHQKAPEQNAEAQRPEPLAVEEGVDLDGFPGPLHRSRSQFYLASPDASPPLTPITTVLDTPPEPTSTPPPSEVSTTQPAPASTMKLSFSFTVAAIAVVSTAQAAVLRGLTTPTLHIFGDSLSDVGTLKSLTLGIIPPKPYWEGRFSSGPVWNEYLAKLLGYNLYNKAIGGSTSNNKNSALLDFSPIDLPINIPSTQDQISYFKLNNPLYALSPTRALDIAVLEVGANDFFAEMLNLATNTLTVESFVETLSNTVVDQLEQLRKIGFKNIVVANMAAIQYTPFADILNIQALANTTVTLYNKQLQAKANAWASKASGLGYYTIADIGGFVEATIKSPAVTNALGLSDTKTSCVGGNLLNLVQADNKLLALLKLIVNAKENLMCSDPSKSYFFDFVHPAERIQRLFGYYGKELVTALISGTTVDLSEAKLLSIIQKYNLGSAVSKPVKV
ncbi:RasGAP protein [Coemansia sp. Benny D115]|nr:RasGAP protein [Coemansia sp. Benny D115]